MTRNVTLADEERRLLMQLLGHEWNVKDMERNSSQPDSPQEAAALADQQTIETIQGKLR